MPGARRITSATAASREAAVAPVPGTTCARAEGTPGGVCPSLPAARAGTMPAVSLREPVDTERFLGRAGREDGWGCAGRSTTGAATSTLGLWPPTASASSPCTAASCTRCRCDAPAGRPAGGRRHVSRPPATNYPGGAITADSHDPGTSSCGSPTGERERAYADAGSAGNTTTEPSSSRAISIATSVARLSTTTPSPSW